MTTNSTRSGHTKAFRKWFSQSEKARKQAGLSPGRTPPGIPSAPTDPDEIRRLLFDAVNSIGKDRALSLLHVHRTTLARWLSGSSQIPESAALVLRLAGDGLHPMASPDWADFRFDGDRLYLPDGTYYTARELSGMHYQITALRLAEDRIRRLETSIIDLVRRIDWGSANDPYTCPQDLRSRAFTA